MGKVRFSWFFAGGATEAEEAAERQEAPDSAYDDAPPNLEGRRYDKGIYIITNMTLITPLLQCLLKNHSVNPACDISYYDWISWDANLVRVWKIRGRKWARTTQLQPNIE